jgi:phosphoribosyl 1,2-cyclic phosphodiesterase
MPGTNGFHVCSAIRHDTSLRHALLVAMSGKGFEDTRQSALEASADEFLVKPLDFDHLLSLIERMTVPASGRGRPARSADGHGPTFIRFWGVRGSIPVPGPDTVRYGGNTACVEFRGDGELIILDAGTGIRALGQALDAEFAGQALNLTLLITHSHWDHIQGFPFFRPAYDAANHLRILGFEGTRDGLAGIFSAQMESPYFPIGLAALPGNLSFEELRSMEFNLGEVKVQAAFANHPGVCVGYRLNARAGSMAYLPDHEPFHRTRNRRAVPDTLRSQVTDFARSEDEKIIQFVNGVDALILDAQFDAEEYARHTGWGHSSVDDAVDLAVRAKAKRLFLFHHDPAHNDDKLDQMAAHARKLVAKSGTDLEVEAAREGLKCALGKPARR